MFALHKYINKICEIKWLFDESSKADLEALLFVEFEHKTNHYIISNFKYTYFDLLIGLEELNFTLEKNNDELTIKISP